MLLLGAGNHYRPDTLMTPGAILWLPLFRDKIDDVLEQVKCPVAVFLNRHYREGALVSFVLGGVADLFLLSYLTGMLANGRVVRLFLFDTDDGEFRLRIERWIEKYPDWVVPVWFTQIDDLITKETDGLLIMSHLSYTKLAEDEEVLSRLSSLLVIRRNKSNGKDEEFTDK